MYSTNIIFEKECVHNPKINVGPQISVDNLGKLKTTSKFIIFSCCAEKVCWIYETLQT